jgi:hypothetical protein
MEAKETRLPDLHLTRVPATKRAKSGVAAQRSGPRVDTPD